MDDILVMKKYYANLNRNTEYKKRVTWIEQFPRSVEDTKPFAVIEYIGLYPEMMISHGNAKTSDHEYIRTDEATKAKIHERIKGEYIAPRNV